MADDVFIYQRVKGRKFEQFLAHVDGVQIEVDATAANVAHRAKVILAAHHLNRVRHEVIANGETEKAQASIELAKGDIDAYVVLVDEGPGGNAMSIEFGRAGYIDPETGDTFGQMDALNILGRAANLKREDGVRTRKVRIRRTRKQMKKTKLKDG